MYYIFTIYQLYSTYQYFIFAHGIYVTISYLQWLFGNTYEYLLWLMSYLYDINYLKPLPQLEYQIQSASEQKVIKNDGKQ